LGITRPPSVKMSAYGRSGTSRWRNNHASRYLQVAGEVGEHGVKFSVYRHRPAHHFKQEKQRWII